MRLIIIPLDKHFFLAKGDTAIGIYESESFSLSCLLYASTTV